MGVTRIWLDRGEAIHGGVTVRTVWRLIDGAWTRVMADALIDHGYFTGLVPLFRRDA
jgi:hypothetical protein